MRVAKDGNPYGFSVHKVSAHIFGSMKARAPYVFTQYVNASVGEDALDIPFTFAPISLMLRRGECPHPPVFYVHTTVSAPVGSILRIARRGVPRLYSPDGE